MTELLVVTETSPEVGDLFAALAKAQGEIKDASKDAKNDHFRSSYATLASVAEACRAALSKHGVAVIQVPFNDDGDVGVATTLGVASGQWMRGRLQVQPTKYDAQAVGSVITYLRRYSLAAMAGVAPADDDDDGNAAVGRPQQRNTAPRAEPTRQQAEQREADGKSNGQANGADRAASREQKEANEKATMQALYNELCKTIEDTLDHGELDELVKTRAADFAKIKEFSATSGDKLDKRVTARHDAISRGPGADRPKGGDLADPGNEP